jgi:hypothetical protein
VKYISTNVDCRRLRPFVKELVDRCGNMKEAGEYAMVSGNTIRRILNNEHCTTQRETARKLILALEHRREEDRKNHSTSARLLAERKKAASIEARRERDNGSTR